MSDEIDQYLYDNPINKDNLNCLIRSFDSSKYIAFLGAGIGSSIRDVPDNKELYNKLCERYEFPYKLDEDKITPSQYSKLFSFCKNKSCFDTDVFNIIKSRTSSSTYTSLKVAQAFNCFITTNYYDPVEKAFQDKQSIAKETPEYLERYYFCFPEILGKKSKYTITYLHGNVLIGLCILKQEDYDYFYPSISGINGSYSVENSMSYIFNNKYIVFIGTSFEDNMKLFLKSIIINYNETTPDKSNDRVKYHYWLCNDKAINIYLQGINRELLSQKEELFFNDYKSINIKPIIYTSENHIFIEHLLEILKHKNENMSQAVMNDGVLPNAI